MKQHLAVVNSNRLNRCNMLFTVGALESGLAKSWNVGVPMHIGHDLHRLIAWSRGLGIHLEPGLARLTAISYTPENEAEADQLRALANQQRAERLREAVQPHLIELQTRLGQYLTDEHSPCNPGCAAFYDPQLAARAFPDLFAQKDKDGLIPIGPLRPVGPGVFERDGLLIFAHPYFRRSLSRVNSLNGAFLTRLYALHGEAELKVRIALDEDIVGLASTFSDYFELEYWWGPKFSDEVKQIPIPTITRHEATDIERNFHGISRTEFWWYAQDEARSFECEELQDLPAFGVGSGIFGCRFVHSRFDSKAGRPVHLDGAIRSYDEDAMVRRLDQDIHHAGRHSDYTKLWRVDGLLSVARWKELICHYYRDNKLVGEYFGGVDASDHAVPAAIPDEDPVGSLSAFVPWDMRRGDGVRIHVAYHPKEDGSRSPRHIIALDWLSRGTERFNFVESETADLVKLLRREGRGVEFPSDIMRIGFEDMVVNLPLVMHSGPEAYSLAQETFSAVTTLCGMWAERGDDRLLSFTIGIEYGDRDVYFAFAGHVTDFHQWLGTFSMRFPDATTQLGTWVEEIYTSFLPECRAANDIPNLAAMMQKSGVLMFKRQFLDPGDFIIQFDEKREQLVAELRIPREKEAVCKLITSETLHVKPCFLYRKTECSRCKQCYESCDCCKYLDPGVKQVVKKFDLLGAFWTTRPA
jgi:hypothetical protein